MPHMTMDDAVLFINKKFEEFQDANDIRHKSILKALANFNHKVTTLNILPSYSHCSSHVTNTLQKSPAFTLQLLPIYLTSTSLILIHFHYGQNNNLPKPPPQTNYLPFQNYFYQSY
ncbi:unnamed protein product [Lupinus luteus]|uniref:Uncharacterized protein n=1 Tax=Lupinus luteus TaxID=3873 RepID=A0AAV1W6L4_LUPLU